MTGPAVRPRSTGGGERPFVGAGPVAPVDDERGGPQDDLERAEGRVVPLGYRRGHPRLDERRLAGEGEAGGDPRVGPGRLDLTDEGERHLAGVAGASWEPGHDPGPQRVQRSLTEQWGEDVVEVVQCLSSSAP